MKILAIGDPRSELPKNLDLIVKKNDKAILFSGDEDFAPLLKYVRNKNKKVEVISFDELALRNLLN